MGTTAYTELVTELRHLAMLSSIGAVLGWDERTVMPPGGANWRAEQSSYIAKTVHERFTSPRIGDVLLKAAEEVAKLEWHSVENANVREARRRYDRARRIPGSLVEEISRTTVHSEQAWGKARKDNDYKAFKPWLSKMLDLKRQEIACYGYDTEPYDALLDDFEPGERAENLRRVFDSLRAPLIELLRKIVHSGKVAPLEILTRNYPKAGQEILARRAAAAIGFDFEHGALAVSTHPFCSGIGPGDTRMTTRYDESYFPDAFFGVLHETGHALYEQGQLKEHFGTPSGEAISLGIHESQSRLWENLVGRSRSFWKHFLPQAKEIFPDTLRGVDDDQFYRAINDIRPSLIRVEADEATYNLHVLIRFELETALLSNDVSVDDLPEVWNAKVKQYLGIEVPDNRQGCLQDVHWSAGLIGYFPTYTLGNLYAAQFFEQARKDLGDLDAQFARGEFAPLLGWLRKNIHNLGRRYTAPELVQKITGKPLSSEPLLKYLKGKAAEVYGV
jgi:carboxypeptidase Taq